VVLTFERLDESQHSRCASKVVVAGPVGVSQGSEDSIIQAEICSPHQDSHGVKLLVRSVVERRDFPQSLNARGSTPGT